MRFNRSMEIIFASLAAFVFDPIILSTHSPNSVSERIDMLHFVNWAYFTLLATFKANKYHWHAFLLLLTMFLTAFVAYLRLFMQHPDSSRYFVHRVVALEPRIDISLNGLCGDCYTHDYATLIACGLRIVSFYPSISCVFYGFLLLLFNPSE